MYKVQNKFELDKIYYKYIETYSIMVGISKVCSSLDNVTYSVIMSHCTHESTWERKNLILTKFNIREFYY
jgi:hypothetical protein